MSNSFIKQFEFEEWANKQILAGLEAINDDDERSLLLLSHILSSHAMWLNRVKGEPLSCSLFQVRTFTECAELIVENSVGWHDFINSDEPDKMSRVIHFTNLVDGTNKKITVEDAMIHILGHSAYHRGQIVARMKGKIEPLPSITYIFFASEAD